jgi:malonate transporter and related proteins
MDQIAGIVVPVFGLIGIGYAVAWSGLLRMETGEALADFVFTVAIPVLIFRVVATADFAGGTPWFLWLAYYIGFVLAWIAGTFLVRRLFERDARAGLVAGVSAAYGNALLVGIPLIITAYGSEGAAAISLLIAVHLPILMTASAILIERALVTDGLSPDADARAIAASLVRNLVKNPIILGLFAGILWRLTGLPIVGPAGTVVTKIADVAATLALFSVGMNLRKYGISGNVRQALTVAAIKLVAMPAVVFLLVLTVIPLPTVWAKAIVIAAACPTGVNAYLVANRFQVGQALASNAITLTTGLAVVTIAVWLNVVEWL